MLEDAVVGHQRDAKSQRGGRDPAVGVVLSLAERVAGSLAGDAERDVGGEVGAGVDNLGSRDLSFEAGRAGSAPASADRAEAQLGDGLEDRNAGRGTRSGL